MHQGAAPPLTRSGRPDGRVRGTPAGLSPGVPNEPHGARPALPWAHQREEVVQLSDKRFGTLEVAGR